MHVLRHSVRDGVNGSGSCHHLIINVRHSLLIDCSLFQDSEISADCKTDAERLPSASTLPASKS